MERIPDRLRHRLKVESGLNDGLALPFLVALTAAMGEGKADPAAMTAELAGGISLGIAIPWGISWMRKIPFLSAAEAQRPVLVHEIL